jgi:hypothetical protein
MTRQGWNPRGIFGHSLRTQAVQELRDRLNAPSAARPSVQASKRPRGNTACDHPLTRRRRANPDRHTGSDFCAYNKTFAQYVYTEAG